MNGMSKGMTLSEPTFGHGKVCYIQMPAVDIRATAAFYQAVFNWTIRERGDGEVAFDDGVGEVSGMWSTDLAAVDHPGLIVSIMVDDAVAASGAIIAAGGTIVDAIDPAATEIHGTFRDPGGNLLSIYQHRGPEGE